MATMAGTATVASDEGSARDSPNFKDGTLSDTESDRHGSPEAEDENIWPEDVEQAFEEALQIYPPIGRRKLLENGKMYGRNELIARYIFKRTQKLRSRKQVSSHIQVLGKKQKKANEAKQAMTRNGTLSGGAAATPTLSSPTQRTPATAPTTSATFSQRTAAPGATMTFPATFSDQTASRPLGNQQQNSFTASALQAFSSQNFQLKSDANDLSFFNNLAPNNMMMTNAGFGRNVSVPQVTLKNFSAYLEHEIPSMTGMQIARHHFVYHAPNYVTHMGRLPISEVESKFSGLRDLFQRGPASSFSVVRLRANMNCVHSYGLYALATKYESQELLTLRCSTMVCSFGKPVVEKVQMETPSKENGSYVYYFNHSPMCDYLVHFIDRLKSLGNTEKMDKVLEYFSVLQTITDMTTNTTVSCTAFLFTVSSMVQTNLVYQLVPDQ